MQWPRERTIRRAFVFWGGPVSHPHSRKSSYRMNPLAERGRPRCPIFKPLNFPFVDKHAVPITGTISIEIFTAHNLIRAPTVNR
ncbi:hypothetical protein CTA1_1394 [Colletotrichum tanaceti]|uniref:Uncharacterized protein n=1 Tax=Colletotrichum tanaceti TaxID=1306861 RepID=A0A4U6X702_9PEZI|nr:hypothetical protein CTA1_1394 [Colletotrichum tanaceti]